MEPIRGVLLNILPDHLKKHRSLV